MNDTANKESVITTQMIVQWDELTSLIPQWLNLAHSATDANVFYEPWVLLPSLEKLQHNQELLFLCMYTSDPAHPKDPPLLCAFFPMEKGSRFRGIPCAVIQLLKTPYSRLNTPLVHRDYVHESIRALLDWFDSSLNSCSLIELEFLTKGGRVAQELHQQVTDRRWGIYQYECTIRALLKPQSNADIYLKKALQGKHLKEFRRLERKLMKLGATEFRTLEPKDDHAPWIASFLELESRGWKGNKKTSLASNQATQEFFEEMTAEAHRNGQLMMLGLFHKGKPIALKCNILSGNGAFAFKIAYDEEFAAYSPGTLLELENIRLFHLMPQLTWMDSTAESHHFMINRLWLDRRSIENLILSPNRAWGNFIIASMPILRWIKRALSSIFK